MARKKSKGRGKNGSRPNAQEAPKPARATRRVSDTVIARMLDEHMQESLSDIAALRIKIEASFSGGIFNYDRTPGKGANGLSKSERALDAIQALKNWEKHCEKRKYAWQTVTLTIGGLSHGAISKQLRLSRECVRLHMRASLVLWSLARKRCGTEEVDSNDRNLRESCRLKRK
jgi:hypothetical protein